LTSNDKNSTKQTKQKPNPHPNNHSKYPRQQTNNIPSKQLKPQSFFLIFPHKRLQRFNDTANQTRPRIN